VLSTLLSLAVGFSFLWNVDHFYNKIATIEEINEKVKGLLRMGMLGLLFVAELALIRLFYCFVAIQRVSYFRVRSWIPQKTLNKHQLTGHSFKTKYF
jgi:hypothetical protein